MHIDDIKRGLRAEIKETTIIEKESNSLTTEVQKVDWLNNEIKRLEDLLESGCLDAENVEYSIQMF